MSRRLNDLKGKVFGRWTVLEFVETRYKPGGGQCGIWLCRCECGTVSPVWASSLTTKHERSQSRSCGCLQRERVSDRVFKHGENQRNSLEYRTWNHIKQRCYDKNDPNYHKYGGRGIYVCDQWLGKYGYSCFLADMGRKPTPDHSIDRFPDQNGPYSPENCRWATRSEQARNRGTNRLITYLGETLPLITWSERCGLSRKLVRLRIVRLGWSVERALTEPVQKQGRNQEKKTWLDEEVSVR